jgi:hypothetical protein
MLIEEGGLRASLFYEGPNANVHGVPSAWWGIAGKDGGREQAALRTRRVS